MNIIENSIVSSMYKDDIYKELTNEFEQIRTCIGQYIGRYETEGAMHLLKEIVNNHIDECTNENSPSRRIVITFVEELGEFITSDEGRGIPFDIMVKVCATKHTSTKFDRDKKHSRYQCGRNGVGMTVVTALSDYMHLTSMRDNKIKTIQFTDGELTECPVSKLKKDEHGTIVKFKPSEKYLGKINITVDLVENYLRHISYILNPEIRIDFYGQKKGADKLTTRKYTYQGLSENVKFISSDLEFEPVDISFSNDNFDLSMAFSYDRTLDEMIIDSYANYVITTERGTHELAAQRAICEFFSRESKKADPNNKFEVTYDDCKKGLLIGVNLFHLDPKYEGQHKSKISNNDVLSDGKRGLTEALTKYFNTNNGLLRKIINYLRQISKIRMEANKIKGVSMKKVTTFMDDADIKGFYNITDRNYQGYSELYISEGDSAGGAILKVRNGKFQAVYTGGQGVVDNVHGLTIAQLLQKATFANLIKILGCGIGKDFDISKLKFKKVIICTDADIDGHNITSLYLLFFFIFVPQLIEEGIVYKALPPLYLLKNMTKLYKGNKWLYDKKEYFGIKHELIANNVEICLQFPEIISKDETSNTNGTVEKLTKREKIQWLNLNDEYTLELESLITRTACNPLILEYVCFNKLMCSNDMEFKVSIEKEFNELEFFLDEKVLYGSYLGESVSLIIDDVFIRNAERFMNLLSQNPTFIIYTANKNDTDQKFQMITIGKFLSMMDVKFSLDIEKRYKGLGEAGAELLFITTLNPRTRKLIRLNITDLKKTLELFDMLHGRKDDKREQRRTLLENFNFKLSDIDN